MVSEVQQESPGFHVLFEGTQGRPEVGKAGCEFLVLDLLVGCFSVFDAVSHVGECETGHLKFVCLERVWKGI